MSKHTKGPWHIRAERYRFIHVWSHGGGIAHLDTTDGEGMANARLISAAPDLFDACQRLVEWCDKNQPAGDALYFVELAREAVLKAAPHNAELCGGPSGLSERAPGYASAPKTEE